MAARLLVVEDEAKLASLLRQGLEEEGYAVDWVLTGEEALARLEHFPPSFNDRGRTSSWHRWD